MLLLPRSQSADLGRWTFRRFRKSIALDNIRKGFRRSENQGKNYKIKISCTQIDLLQLNSLKTRSCPQSNFREIFGLKRQKKLHS